MKTAFNKLPKKQQKALEGTMKYLSGEPFAQVVHTWQSLTEAVKTAEAEHLTTVDGYTVSELIVMRNLVAAYITAVQTTIKEA